MPARSATSALLAAAIAAAFVASGVLRQRLVHEGEPRNTQGSYEPRRIVSLAPSVTETLYALGAGDRVVGVTSFCDFPPAAKQNPRIGGFLDPNLEAIVALQPDLVVLLAGERDCAEPFRELGLEVMTVDHRSIEGIVESIRTLGQTCGAREKAEAMRADIDDRLQRVREKTAGLARPRVLLVVERTRGTGRVRDAMVAGCDRHLSRCVELAGGENVLAESRAAFPTVSAEGIINIDPDVIVELVPPGSRRGTNHEQAADWQHLDRVAAVRAGRVYLLDDDFAFSPGPRFVLLVEKLARLFHPEVHWQP